MTTTTNTTNVEQLFEDNLKLVYSTVYKSFNNPEFQKAHCITLDEVVQHGRIGLLKACQTYDSNKKTKFSTHAINHIKWAVSNECKREGIYNKKWSTDFHGNQSLDRIISSHDNEEATLLDYLTYEDYQFEEVAEKERLETIFNNIEQKISERVADMVRLKYLGYTNQQIGSKLGVSRQLVEYQLRNYKDVIRGIIVA